MDVQTMAIESVLRGKKILLLEDDVLQAQSLAFELEEYGVEVIGPFHVSEDGLRSAGRDAVDAAILDVHLFDGNCFSVADALMRRRIPFIFLSGHERRAMPDRYRHVPHYLKPFAGDDVTAALSLAVTDRYRHRP
ncbi:response regulator [Ensifer soli]|uniref:response regulator n=1 Tax=Ciceribacter sp. sgz301302 TaxID=3342379 RepID=UPI0035B78085